MREKGKKMSTRNETFSILKIILVCKSSKKVFARKKTLAASIFCAVANWIVFISAKIKYVRGENRIGS